jgi:hypothetical protein
MPRIGYGTRAVIDEGVREARWPDLPGSCRKSLRQVCTPGPYGAIVVPPSTTIVWPVM